MAKISKKKSKVPKSNFGYFPGARLTRNQELGLPPPNFSKSSQITSAAAAGQPTKISVATSTSDLCTGLNRATSTTSLNLDFQNLTVSKGQFSDVSESESEPEILSSSDPHFKFKRYEETTTISSAGNENIPTSSTYFSLLTVGLGRGLGRGIGRGKQYRAEFRTTENNSEGRTAENLVNTNLGRGKSPGHFQKRNDANTINLSFDQLPDGKKLKYLSLHPSTETPDTPNQSKSTSQIKIHGLSTSSSHPVMVISSDSE